MRKTSPKLFDRLNNDSHIPKKGENWVGYKDLLEYIDPTDATKAYLAAEDPKNQDTWTLYALPEYGKWFQTEMNLT